MLIIFISEDFFCLLDGCCFGRKQGVNLGLFKVMKFLLLRIFECVTQCFSLEI